jgi:hypothetical protein
VDMNERIRRVRARLAKDTQAAASAKRVWRVSLVKYPKPIAR